MPRGPTPWMDTRPVSKPGRARGVAAAAALLLCFPLTAPAQEDGTPPSGPVVQSAQTSQPGKLPGIIVTPPAATKKPATSPKRKSTSAGPAPLVQLKQPPI